MRDIEAAADAHYDRMWDQICEDEALAEYLEERGITYEQHLAEVEQAEEDAAEDAYYWSKA